jgi:hypothetical protein
VASSDWMIRSYGKIPFVLACLPQQIHIQFGIQNKSNKNLQMQQKLTVYLPIVPFWILLSYKQWESQLFAYELKEVYVYLLKSIICISEK